MLRKSLSPIFFEFVRYSIVGGIAFLIDFGTLYLTKTYVFSGLGTQGILLATCMGFITGLVFNYIFSLTFVFKQISEDTKKHKTRSFFVFTIIGVIGLCLTEFFMYAGIMLFDQQFYLFIKIITAGIVLLWNYIGRKIFIFKGAQYGGE